MRETVAILPKSDHRKALNFFWHAQKPRPKTATRVFKEKGLTSCWINVTSISTHEDDCLRRHELDSAARLCMIWACSTLVWLNSAFGVRFGFGSMPGDSVHLFLGRFKLLFGWFTVFRPSLKLFEGFKIGFGGLEATLGYFWSSMNVIYFILGTNFIG